jgi:hypothetical protein
MEADKPSSTLAFNLEPCKAESSLTGSLRGRIKELEGQVLDLQEEVAFLKRQCPRKPVLVSRSTSDWK